MLDQETVRDEVGLSFVCTDCGYGITVRGEQPACPMCRGTSWEPAPWRPFTNSLEHATLLGAREAAR